MVSEINNQWFFSFKTNGRNNLKQPKTTRINQKQPNVYVYVNVNVNENEKRRIRRRKTQNSNFRLLIRFVRCIYGN